MLIFNLFVWCCCSDLLKKSFGQLEPYCGSGHIIIIITTSRAISFVFAIILHGVTLKK